ncbi:MAG: hypothetical protein NTY19_01920 [Planctomycetota bacterium]|nr:hypothetical protein [Planctomycetota bacterium]
MPRYPKTLELAEWNKNKGKVEEKDSKGKQDTRITMALKMLQKDYERVPWNELDFVAAEREECKKLGCGVPSTWIKKKQTEITNLYNKEVKGTFCKSLGQFVAFINQVAAQHKKAKSVPSNVQKYIASMAEEAKTFHDLLSNRFLGLLQADIPDYLKGAEQREEATIKDLAQSVKNMEGKWQECQAKMKDASDDDNKVTLYNAFYMESGPNTVAGNLLTWQTAVCPQDTTIATHLKIWKVLGDRSTREPRAPRVIVHCPR